MKIRKGTAALAGIAVIVAGIAVAEQLNVINVSGSTNVRDANAPEILAAMNFYNPVGLDLDDYFTVTNTDTGESADWYFDGNGWFEPRERDGGGSGSGGDPSGPGNTGNNPGNGRYPGNGNSGGANGGTVTVRPLIPVRPT